MSKDANPKSRILLALILKDDSEIEMARRMLSSFMPHMAGLAVALTGPTGQFEKLKKLISSHNGRYIECSPKTHPQLYGEKEGKFFFANFAEARNVSFELASWVQGEGKYDWWMWADVDDVLAEGEELHQAALRASELGLDCVFFTYWYAVAVDEEGSIREVLIDHLRERLLKPDTFKWISRLHEVAVPLDGNYQPKQTAYDYSPSENRHCVWIHLPGNERVQAALQRNIDILEIQAKEEEHKDPRTLFYLAKTYYDLADPTKYQLSLLLLDEYLEMSGWAEERAGAWEYKAKIFGLMGDHRKAIDCLHEAIREYPNRHMQYLSLAKEYSEMGLHEESSFWLDLALKMEPPKARTTIGNPAELKVLAASLKYNEAIRQTKLDEAIYWLSIRNKLMGGGDEGMLETLKQSKAMDEAAKNVFSYAKWLKDQGHTEQVRKLLDAIAPELKHEQFVTFIANEVVEPTTWEDNSIVYFAGSHFAQWNPKVALNEGLGGSETAVIRLSEEWSKLGYAVTVFANVSQECEHNGVTYKHWSSINWKDAFNILILWRNASLLDMDLKANKVFVDLHDVVSALEFTDERIRKADKVFFKSKYHRNMVPKLEDRKVAIISNGI